MLQGGTQLYAVAIPSRGGDTLFASMYEAYEALPDRPEAAHRRDCRPSTSMAVARARATSSWNRRTRDLPPAVHPVVRVHEETGRKSLYANPTHILRIRG